MQANAFAAKSRAWRMGIGSLSKGIIGMILVGLLAGQVIAATNITDVKVMNKPDRVVVSVHGNGPLKMVALSSSSSRFVGFQFSGRLVAKGRLVSIRSGRIYNVRYSSFAQNPPSARVVLNTASHLDYSTAWNDNKTQVDITVWKFGASPSTKTAPAFDADIGPQLTADFLPVLPPVEMRGPQGAEPGKLTESLPAMPTPTPMQVVRVAPLAAQIAKPVPATPQSTEMQVVRVASPIVRVAKPAPATVRVAKITATPASFGAGKNVSLSFLGADIADVLKALSVQSGENIVVGSDVIGSITVTLDNVTVEEALDYITQLSGYHYIKDQHTYLVGSTGTVGGLVDAKVEIITLAYANADDMLEMLKVQCPQVRTSKISVRGGTARVHKQELHQGTVKDSGAAGGATASEAGAGAPSDQGVGADGQPSESSENAGATTAGPSKSVQAKQIQDVIESVPSKSDKSPTSNLIALVGSAEKVAAAKLFVDQVEDAMRDQSADKKVSVYLVKYVNTWELANTIMSLVLGVNVTIGPSDESGPSGPPLGQMSLRNVPANMLSGEDIHRPYHDFQNTGAAPPNSHTLIMVGKEVDVQKALETAAQFDTPGERDLAVYKVKYVDVNELAATIRQLVPGVAAEGVNVASATKGAGESSPAASGGGASTPAADSGSQGTTAMNMSSAALDNLSRTLVLTGRKSDVEKARGLIEALDVRSPQIKIEAKITSLTETGEKKLGLSWNWSGVQFNESVLVQDGMPDKATNRYWRDPLNFGAKLDALITNGDGTLLAAPSLICLEGKPGMFFVGDQIRFVTQISAGNNGSPTVTTDTANVGVQLSVVGNVSDDGYITLNLHPEVSTLKLDDKVSTPGIALTLPRITRRYTDHVVRVKSGETIVIGGLINDEELDTMSKIPLLGDIPVLGHLFRHRNKTKDHSEVVIFITASVVND